MGWGVGLPCTAGEELNFLTEILTTKKAVRSNDSFTKTNYIRIRNVLFGCFAQSGAQ